MHEIVVTRNLLKQSFCGLIAGHHTGTLWKQLSNVMDFAGSVRQMARRRRQREQRASALIQPSLLQKRLRRREIRNYKVVSEHPRTLGWQRGERNVVQDSVRHDDQTFDMAQVTLAFEGHDEQGQETFTGFDPLWAPGQDQVAKQIDPGGEVVRTHLYTAAMDRVVGDRQDAEELFSDHVLDQRRTAGNPPLNRQRIWRVGCIAADLIIVSRFQQLFVGSLRSL